MYQITASTRTRDAIRAGQDARTEALRAAFGRVFHRKAR